MAKLPPPESFADPRTPVDKRRTSYFDCVVVDGIEITSRYNHGYEFKLMAVWVRRLPPGVRTLIASIDCDSKATCTYTVKLRPGHAHSSIPPAALAFHLNAVMRELDGGHNGIWIESAAGTSIHIIEPDWEGDDADVD